MKSMLPPTPNRDLTPQEVDSVLDRVPIIVLADDEPIILMLMVEYLTLGRKNTESVLRLDGDMEQCFEAVSSKKPDELPIVLCRDGAQAMTATRIIAERRIDDGLMLFDHKMGLPNGLDIFKGINGNLPPAITKGLMSATPPDDAAECLKKGVLDLLLTKPFPMERTRKAIAQTFLSKTLKHAPL